MILMGSSSRLKLMQVLQQQIGSDARKKEARTRVRLAQQIHSVENQLLNKKPKNAKKINGSKHAEFYLDEDSSRSQQSLNNQSPTLPADDR